MDRSLPILILFFTALTVSSGCTETQSVTAHHAVTKVEQRDFSQRKDVESPPAAQADTRSTGLRAAQQLRRRMAYEREGTIELPNTFPQSLRAVLESQPGRKLVRVQISQNMKATTTCARSIQIRNSLGESAREPNLERLHKAESGSHRMDASSG